MATTGDVIRCLEEVFTRFTKPVATYMDPGQHFENEELRQYLRGLGVSIDYSPSGSHKSTGMIEVSKRILEAVLAKDNNEWDKTLPRTTQIVNCRTIEHLGISPTGILTGAEHSSLAGADMKLTKLPLALQNVRKTVDLLTTHPYVHQAAVRVYLQHRAEVYDPLQQRSFRRKEE